MTLYTPINHQQQQQVCEATQKYVQLASEHFSRSFASIHVLFDLKGRMAGMYKVDRGKRLIRFNPWLFAKYFDENVRTTVPHEVAHYISDCLYGIRNIRPHGKEWKTIMQLFAADDSRTHQFDMQGIPVRRQRRYDYQCACQHYQLTTQRHRKILSGERRYLCRQCKQPLHPV